MAFRVKCNRCNGFGYYSPYHDKTCQTCGGQQEIVLEGDRDQYVECQRCNGLGYYSPYREKGCSACNGTGLRRIASAVTPAALVKDLDLHPEIQAACGPLYLDGHYAEAVFKACKALIHMVKNKSGRNNLDGVKLMHTVFSEDKPILKLNKLRNQSDRDEHEGLRFLFAGVVKAIRNPRGHETDLADSPKRARQLLSFLSYLAECVDGARKARPSSRTKAAPRNSGEVD